MYVELPVAALLIGLAVAFVIGLVAGYAARTSRGDLQNGAPAFGPTRNTLAAPTTEGLL